MRRSAFALLPPLVLLALALVVRLRQHHAALLYPDGYQYLLMARGIGEHLQPTTVLGPGGEAFVPSPDAAVKPFFPLLVAGAHAVGLPWLDAARIVTAVAAAFAVLAVTLLVTKLSGSTLAGLGAGLLLVASPGLGFWSGFSGPDPVAEALALGAALAFVHRRPRTGGILTGLAIATRPEIAVVALAVAIVSIRSEDARRDVVRAAPETIVTTGLVYLVLRTPVTVENWHLLWLAPVVVGLAAASIIVPDRLLRYAVIASAAPALLVLGTQSGPQLVWQHDWPLIVVGAAGLVLLVRSERGATIACVALGIVLLLGAVYALKNPSLERYFALLLPAAAVLAGVGVASLPLQLRPVALGAVALAIVGSVLRPVPGSRDYDMFSVVARQVAPSLTSAPLITAAPDAYGFWLPSHTVRAMQPGARGAVLLDAAQRAYEPNLTATGTVVRRIQDEIAFSRTNGDIDAAPAVLVRGRVLVARRSSATR